MFKNRTAKVSQFPAYCWGFAHVISFAAPFSLIIFHILLARDASTAFFASRLFVCFSTLSWLQSSSYASEHPKGGWSCVGQGCSQQFWFHHPSCISCVSALVVVMMCNLPESVHFALELCVPPLVQRRGASLIQRIGRRSLGCCLALTTDNEHLSISEFEAPLRPCQGALWVIEVDSMSWAERVLKAPAIKSWQPHRWAWFQWVSKSQGCALCSVDSLATAVPKSSHSYPKPLFFQYFQHFKGK